MLIFNGLREGLFLAGIAAERWAKGRPGRPAILMPNPFYGAYEAGAVAAHADPVFLPATAATGFLPDLDALTDELLARTVAFYLASPANPQGWVVSADYMARLAALARQHGFIVFSDECYSEIYTKVPPPSMLEHSGRDFENVVAFQSLSKRSNLPGLRVGFVAGDRKFLARFLELRNVSSPQVPISGRSGSRSRRTTTKPMSTQAAALYAQKFDLADQILGNRYGYRPPAGGFLLWLDVSAHGGDEAVTLLGPGRKRGCASSRAAISPANRKTASIPARAISASPSYRTATPRPRRCIAWSRRWVEDRTCRPSTADSKASVSPTACATRCASACAS